MIYTEFIQKLKAIPFAPDIYLREGVSPEFVKKRISSYNPQLKSGIAAAYLGEDELIKLISSYDLTLTEIGMISFLSIPISNVDKIFFGKFEVDMLAIDKITGEIRCYEHSKDNVLWACAKNAGAFLDAIYEGCCFLEKRVIDENLYNDESLSESVVDYCAEIAGGQQYRDFYNVLLS